MHTADDLIRNIVSASQVPSGAKRREIERELHAHIGDFITVARDAGHSEDEVQRLVNMNFGNPHEIAADFANVYRHERAVFQIWIFLVALLAVTSLISIVVFLLQASLAIGLNVPVSRVFASRHLEMETLYIFLTVASYRSLLSLEKLFKSTAVLKAAGLLALLFAGLSYGLSNIGFPPEIIGAAFASGVMLRSAQVYLKNPRARIGVALACFGAVGFISACSQFQTAAGIAIMQLAVWPAIGLCGHFMANLSGRMDRALSNGLQ